MSEKEIKHTLDWFQKFSEKTFISAGFNIDNCNVVFGIIIGMRNLVVASQKKDLILLHKSMGKVSWYLANYCSLNNLKISEVIANFSYLELILKVPDEVDLEYFLQKIKDEMSFVQDMSVEDKIEFVQKCWVCIFPKDYHDEFLKIDKILRQHIEDNKIKTPEAFV